jgi:HSP20 family protein
VRLDVPGLEKDALRVKAENGVLTLSGERKREAVDSDQAGGFTRMERSYGAFSRSLPLPADADTDRMTAETSQGVLTVTVPKRTEARKPAQRVPVR